MTNVGARMAVVIVRSSLAIFAGVTLGLTGPACGSSGPVTVTERITRDFGAELVSARERVTLESGQTVVDILQRRHDVELAEDGGAIEAIDGLRQDTGAVAGDRWVLSVNGIVIDENASDYEPRTGDVVQWDLRRGSEDLPVRATVGAYPETFLRGAFGTEPVTAAGCVNPNAYACLQIRRALSEAGVALRERSLVIDGIAAHSDDDSATDGPRGAELLIGAWHHLAEYEWARSLFEGPSQSGVFVRIRIGPETQHYGDKLDILDSNGDVDHTLRRGDGLVAALRPTDNHLLWLITGVDAEGADRAARALTTGKLRDMYAAVVTPERIYPVPVAPG